MPEYLSPGVYVEEVPSAVQPIAGVGTSTAGFVGIIPDSIEIPEAKSVTNESIGTGDGKTKEFDLDNYPVNFQPGSFAIKVNGKPVSSEAKQVTDEEIGTGDGTTKEFDLHNYPAMIGANFEIRVDNKKVIDVKISNDVDNTKSKVVFTNAPPNLAQIRGDYNTIVGVVLSNYDEVKKSKAKFTNAAPPKNASITGDYKLASKFKPIPLKEVKLCTNFSEFKTFFGDFSNDEDQRRLAHGVYGFFNNGGTRCYVMRFETTKNLQKTDALEPFEAIDEIALIAAPGINDSVVQTNMLDHCIKMGNRFAILDSEEKIKDGLTKDKIKTPGNDKNAALYFPWIQVFDPVKEPMYVGPSGHLAGIYARVDTERGVHKAPANEVVRGALGLKYAISKSVQDGLNPDGINCIRDLNGNIKVWGGRTIGGENNGEWKYINVRRLFLFLRESIDRGTQWVVFEPNDPSLWAKITRNVTAFLTNVWRDGALFGTTPQEAFYVKCDEETNPPEVRDQGRVVTEIGVAIVKPAEFVIFRISQWAGSGK